MAQKPKIKYIQSQKLSMVQEPTTIIPDSKITDSRQLSESLRQLISGSNFDLSYQEHFFVLGLSQRNKVTIFAHISTGGTNCTVVDKKVIFSHLILSGSQAFILCHNHPSGNMTPSDQDRKVTNELKQAGGLLDIRLFDHIILSPDSEYYSFADNGII
jgi:DNA repair protein RadC